MKKIAFEILYICLGVVAFVTRIKLNGGETDYYMSVINWIAGFATILLILYDVLCRMIKKLKKKDGNARRSTKFVIFALSIMILYWTVVVILYKKFDTTLLNDLITVCSLTLALTSDFFESLLLAIFCKD